MKADGQDAQQTIEELTKRYQRLNNKKVAAETNLKNAREQLDELKKQARDEYGTDDLEELRAKLETWKRENEEKRADYQASLDKIEGELSTIEEKYDRMGSEIEAS